MLELKNIHSGYGHTEILFGPSLSVGKGEFVTLLGRNGMGKTTLVKTVMGLLPLKEGQIEFAGHTLKKMRAYQVARLGLGLVPEGRLVCPNLTAQENLLATARRPENDFTAWTLERVYDLFPRLAERAGNYGNQLSGGEQQLLAIGRALMTNPSLLILDEATEGLAPLIRDQVWGCLDVLRQEGLSVLLIDKNIEVLSRIADRHYILEKGKVVWSGDKSAFIQQRSSLEQYLGV